MGICVYSMNAVEAWPKLVKYPRATHVCVHKYGRTKHTLPGGAVLTPRKHGTAQDGEGSNNTPRRGADGDSEGNTSNISMQQFSRTDDFLRALGSPPPPPPDGEIAATEREAAAVAGDHPACVFVCVSVGVCACEQSFVWM
jgi:hypothetical protein